MRTWQFVLMRTSIFAIPYSVFWGFSRIALSPSMQEIRKTYEKKVRNCMLCFAHDLDCVFMFFLHFFGAFFVTFLVFEAWVAALGALNSPKRLQRGSQEAPKASQEAPKDSQEAPKRLLRGSQEAPRALQSAQKGSQDALTGFQEVPKSVKQLPRSSKRLPRAPLDWFLWVIASICSRLRPDFG